MPSHVMSQFRLACQCVDETQGYKVKRQLQWEANPRTTTTTMGTIAISDDDVEFYFKTQAQSVQESVPGVAAWWQIKPPIRRTVTHAPIGAAADDNFKDFHRRY